MIQIPKTFRGKPVEGAMDRVLKGVNQPTVPAQSPSINPSSPSNIINAEKYLILPGKDYSKYRYDDILVSMDKSYHGQNWFDAHKSLANDGAYMLTIRQFADFLQLLKSGSAYDGKGKKVNKKVLDNILDEIVTVRSPWRSEWLDANFKVVNGKLDINYEHRMTAGKLDPKRQEELNITLMTDKKIDLDDWIAKGHYQGLPKSDVKAGGINYWYPRENCVARFYADSDWAYLFCNRNPTYTFSSLGVRPARAKI